LWKTTIPKMNDFPTKPVHIITWNSMIDYYLAYPSVQSNNRWEFQLLYLEQLQPDIIALNEVQPAMLLIITKSKWIQNNFYISEVPANYSDTSTGNSINPFGNLMLSKYCPHNVYQYHYRCYPR
jgi:endonuclease/exonuclease/phosphatase family metal-dependent hydrolase